jgi:hypothetical protein
VSIFAERRLREGNPADVSALLEDVRTPPVDAIGAMPIDEVYGFAPPHPRDPPARNRSSR